VHLIQHRQDDGQIHSVLLEVPTSGPGDRLPAVRVSACGGHGEGYASGRYQVPLDRQVYEYGLPGPTVGARS
jgi:hypothetical protein